MHPDNIADGYDLFTGKVNGPVNHYGEIHTGSNHNVVWKNSVLYQIAPDQKFAELVA